MTDHEPIANEISMESDDPESLGEYDFDLRSKLTDHPVFAGERELQRKLNGSVIDAAQFQEIRDAVYPAIKVLDRAVANEGLMGLLAGVRGDAIALPDIEMDFAHGAITIRPSSEAERIDELAKTSLDTDTIRGSFAGYSLRFKRNPELPDTYIPQLVYQIALHNVELQHAYIMPMATGDVGVSELFFDVDERIVSRKEILERLFSAAGDHVSIADEVNQRLVDAERFDGGVLSRVGYDADKMVNLLHGREQQSAEDAICDLIKNYIDLKLFSSAAAERPMRIPLDETTQPVTYLEGMQELNASPTSIDFFDWPVHKSDGTVSSRRRCSLVFDREDHLIVIPLIKVERFE